MIRKLLATLLALVLVICTIPFTAMAAVTPPTTIGAPEHFGVGHYLGDSFYYTFSAPDNLRTIIDNYDPKKVLVIKAQLDYKLGDGNWHYASNWDTANMTLKNTIGFSYIRGVSYTTGGRESLSTMFPEDAKALQPIKASGWNIPGQPLSFRVRFVTSLDENKTYIYSAWSETYVYSKSVKSDPDALINHAPTLISAEVKKNTAGQPVLFIRTGKQPGEVMDLNATVSDGMRTEIWLKKAEDKDFKLVGSNFFRNEYIPVDVSRYFDKTLQSYDAKSYEVKIRYVLNDLRKYPQAGRSDIIYSPFSNRETQINSSISNDVIKQSIENLDSYRRIINTVTTEPKTGNQFTSKKEFAYIKAPVSRYTKLEFPTAKSYHEEIIIGEKSWTRMTPDEKWTAWDSFMSEQPVRLKYDVSTQPYPIDYGKLTYVKSGSEQVNGINCIKYTVSGSYKDLAKFEFSEDSYPITLSASGSIWIADDAVIKQAIIRQRITLDADITVGADGANHAITKDVIEDDVMDINSVVIQPPKN